MKVRYYLLIFLVVLSCKRKCEGQQFSERLIGSIPSIGEQFNSSKFIVENVQMDNTEFSEVSPMNYRECTSTIMVHYKHNDFDFELGLWRSEENDILYSVSGINLSKTHTFKTEQDFFDQQIMAYRIKESDTLNRIQLKGWKIGLVD